MIEAGTLLQQRYRIEKQIGQGGMGAVYVATDERLGSIVAIKETLCMDDNFRRAIEREARLLNSLRHPALPIVSDHFEEDNILFLVMEYIPGDDVAAMLEKDPAIFTVDEVLKWAGQLLDALDYLHKQEIPVIHRDIKPQNLKINSRGDMILLDFGLAKGNPNDASHHTAAKSIFGYSRNYASLEQIQGTGTDPRSDLYSLAATLYHLLTGVPPEDALTRAMRVLSQRPDPMVPASRLNSAVPKGVAGVLQQALDLNTDKRPASAAVMRQMLSEYEAYADVVDDAAAAGLDGRSVVFAQETRLFPESTRAGIRSTEMKTELMPETLSQVTAVAAGAGAGSVRPRGRMFGVTASLAVLMLVGVAVSAGLYMIKPAAFARSPISESPAGVPAAADAASASANAASTTSASTSELTASNIEPLRTEAAIPAVRTGRSSDPTRTTRAAAPVKPASDGAEGDVLVVEVDEPELREPFVFSKRDANGKVVKMHILPKFRPMHSDPAPANPFTMDFGPLMTPEQRKKVQAMVERQLKSAPKPVIPKPPPPTP